MKIQFWLVGFVLSLAILASKNYKVLECWTEKKDENYLIITKGNYHYHYHLFLCLTKTIKQEMIEFTIMARRPQETTRLIREATSAVINK